MKLLLWVVYALCLYCSVFWLLVLIDYKKVLPQLKKGKLPIVSIVIPAYNEEKSIVKTMKSVINLDYPKEKLEILVIDDGSKDRTAQKVKEVIKKYPGAWIRLIQQKNQGKAAALNNALKQLKGKYFACLDADSMVKRKTLKKMLAYFNEENKAFNKKRTNKKELAVVTPVMKIHQPKNFFQKMQWIEYIVAAYMGKLLSIIGTVYVAPGPFSLYKTEIINKVGGFDEETITEDQEIGYRLQNYGYTLKQCPESWVETIAPNNFKGLYKQRLRWYKGGIYNLKKYQHILFNKKYGAFGLFQVPVNIYGYVLYLASLCFFLYLTLYPLLTKLRHFYIIRFDLLPYILNWQLRIDFLNKNLGLLLIFASLILIGLVILYCSHKYSGETMKTWRSLYVVPYLIIYYLFISIFGLAAIYQTYFRKDKWEW